MTLSSGRLAQSKCFLTSTPLPWTPPPDQCLPDDREYCVAQEQVSRRPCHSTRPPLHVYFTSGWQLSRQQQIPRMCATSESVVVFESFGWCVRMSSYACYLVPISCYFTSVAFHPDPWMTAFVSRILFICYFFLYLVLSQGMEILHNTYVFDFRFIRFTCFHWFCLFVWLCSIKKTWIMFIHTFVRHKHALYHIWSFEYYLEIRAVRSERKCDQKHSTIIRQTN